MPMTIQNSKFDKKREQFDIALFFMGVMGDLGIMRIMR